MMRDMPSKVVTVQSDPGGSGVGNKYRLGWKEECVDDDDDSCEVMGEDNFFVWFSSVRFSLVGLFGFGLVRLGLVGSPSLFKPLV